MRLRILVLEKGAYIKTLRAGKYHLWRDTEKAATDLLNQKWFELETEPEMGNRDRW